MAELAGRLSERVRFERRDGVRGSAGEQSDLWRLAFECWAEVKLVAQAGQLPEVADTRHLARRWRLVVRGGRQVTLDMRLLWRGQVLAVCGVEQNPARPAILTIEAEDFGPSRQ